jgi:hypothetical protein
MVMGWFDRCWSVEIVLYIFTNLAPYFLIIRHMYRLEVGVGWSQRAGTHHHMHQFVIVHGVVLRIQRFIQTKGNNWALSTRLAESNQMGE